MPTSGAPSEGHQTGRKHPVDVVPPPIGASPTDLRSRGGVPDEEQWWTPEWGDILRAVGWRWVLLAPAVALSAVALALGVLLGQVTILVWAGQFKLILLFSGVAASVIYFTIRRIVAARKEPFCIHCGYSLVGLPDHGACPECGRPYSWAVIAEYRKDPRFFRQRWREAHSSPIESAPIDAGPGRTADDGTG